MSYLPFGLGNLGSGGVGPPVLYTAPASPLSGPSAESPSYATDEALAIRDSQDYVNLCPRSQLTASGVDGFFSVNLPWVLNSLSTPFAGRGLGPGGVVALSKPPSRFRSPRGDLFAVQSCSGTTATLRRIGKPAGVGDPPSPVAGLTAVAFDALSFGPQLAVASFDAKKFFGIDERETDRSSARLYDSGELEQYVILTVLQRLYAVAQKAKDSDFSMKFGLVSIELADLQSRLTIRWGERGEAHAPTSVFSARVRR